MTKYTNMVVKNEILYTHKMNHRVGSNSCPQFILIIFLMTPKRKHARN